MQTPPAIAIIGGGPCGLTLARLLERKGIDYVVYERDESEQCIRAGGSLDIHPETGQRALREGGLFDAFEKHARYDDAVFTVADRSGSRLLQTGQDRDAPEIDRRELRQILLDAIPKDKIRWGHVLKTAALGEDGVPVLSFVNGVVESGFKLAVGADGAWSKVRPLISQATPKYTGRSYLESRISRENPLYSTMADKTGAGTFMTIGPNKIIVTQRQGDSSYRTYFGLEVPEDFFQARYINNQHPERARDILLAEFFVDWADEYKDLIRHATDFRAWPLYSLSPEDMGWESVLGVTLAGDAAHLAVPNGEGVNIAMTDALVLATKIAEYGMENIERAVREYEADMFARGAETIRDGQMMSKIMFSGDPQTFVDMMTSFGAVAE